MADVDAARRALEEVLGPAEVLSHPLALAVYARDASMLEGRCALVAFPAELEHIVACVRIAAEHGLPIVPRGAGTGLAGGATPFGEALVVVTTKMDRILEVRPEDRLAWVEPGVVTLDLVSAVEPRGLTFAPDPSSRQSSTLGGNVATNAGGPHCLASGVTANHVLALDVVLPDGSVERFGSEGPAAAGYDLRAALVGSEGTLGIVGAACVRLSPIPPAVRTLLLDFSTVEDCAATVSGIIAAGVVPAAMELMDRGIVEAIEGFVHAGYPTDAAAVLVVEVDGTAAATGAQSRVVEDVARAHHVRGVRAAADEGERARLWKGRRNALGSVGRIAPHYYLHDVVVPRTRLAEALTGFYDIGSRHDLAVTCIAHAGDGNLHPHLHFDAREPGVLERVLAASEEVVRLAVDLGGTLSGEHGIGLEKRDFLPLVLSAEDRAAQACVRGAFDPELRMNPDKVLPEGTRCAEVPTAGVVAAGANAERAEGRMELIHPHTKADVVEAIRAANASALRLLVVGGRHHADKGNACEVDGELWTTQLDRLVAYEPAEMIAVVEAGMRVGELARILAEGGQEWPSDAPADSTVGGVIAADAQSPRRLRVGRVADSVLQARVVTGDGRLVTSGARTVKNATGYDLHRVLAGSLGTLGVLVQVALKVRPVPQARRTLHAPGPIGTGEALLGAIPGPAGIVATPGEVEVRLEGWREEVEEQTAAARAVVSELDEVDEHAFPSHRPWDEAPVVAEASVRPSALAALAPAAGERWGAHIGVGLLWAGLEGADGPLEALRARASDLGGIAPAIRGPGGLGDAPVPARAVQERLKAAFDPNGVLAPGRFWGGI